MGLRDKVEKNHTVSESARKGYTAIAKSGPANRCRGSRDATGVAKAVDGEENVV